MDAVSTTRRTAAAMYALDVARSEPMTREQEQECVRSGRRDRLVTANLRFAVTRAKRHMRRGIELEDLIQQANLGLIRAASDFDPERGLRFLTYANHWISSIVGKYVEDTTRLVRLPTHTVPMQRAIWNREATTPEELVAQFPVTLDRAKALFCVVQSRPQSIDIHSDEDAPGFQLADAESNTPEHAFAGAEARRLASEMIERAIATMSDRDQDVVRSTMLVHEDDAETLAEIGVRHGVCRERIRQVRNAGLAMIRRAIAREQADAEMAEHAVLAAHRPYVAADDGEAT